MSINRLFLYDPETNTAACIAKGYSPGWARHGTNDHINNFFEKVEEYTGQLPESGTRLQLKTEDDLPRDAEVFYQQ